MKITSLRTVLLTGPATDDPFLKESRKLRSAAIIEIHTDTELVGLGETYAGYFCPELVPGIVDFFAPIVVGQDVSRISEIWNRMYTCGNFWCRVGLGTAVLSGIDAALWDLKGKMTGLPVYELLGGLKHDYLPCYATGGPSNYPKDRLAAKLDYYLSLGFRGFKLGVGSYSPSEGWYTPSSPAEAADFEGDKLSFVRSHVGGEALVMLDGHMGNSTGKTWDLGTAQAVAKAAEVYNLFFFEEPLPYTDPWSYTELCQHTLIAIAGGECLTASCEWRVFVEGNCFDIGQPDASFTGGMGEFMRVAAMLESRGRRVATHCWGAGGSLMQNIHCAFACSNTAILEIPPAYGGLHREIVKDSFHMEKGNVFPPQKSGLGITLTDAIKDRYAFVPGTGEFNSVPGKILSS